MSEWQAQVRTWLRPVAAVLGFRYLCWVVMMALALYGEGRAAPHLPDLIIDRLPYQPLVDRYNHYLLTVAYVPVGIALLFVNPGRFCRYNVTTGLMSVVRGVCIAVTGLGPVRGPDLHAGIFDGHPELYLRALWELSTPGGQLLRDAAHLYLNKDLFFSGHTGATVMLLLYVWPHRRLRAVMLCGHIVVVASVFLSHLHYTIDVIGAYAVAFSLYVLREGWPVKTSPRPEACSAHSL